MAIQLNSNIKIAGPLPIDERYLSSRTSGGSPLPYSADTEVYATIPLTERYLGLTVNINGVEYWFKNNTGTLIVKESGGTVTGGTNGLHLEGKNIALGGTITGSTILTDATGVGIQYGNSDISSFAPNSLVSKLYADAIATGVHPKLAVQAATTANLSYPISGLTTVDGVILTNGDRVLVKNQTTINDWQNGIYVATGTTWQRSSDFDFTPSGETLQGSLVPVVSGNTQGNTLWALVSPDPIISGDSIIFTLFSTVTLIAGNSIDIVGSTISVDITSGTLSSALNSKLDVSVFNAYTGTTQGVINLALTGATNGLTPNGRDVVLGGLLLGNTTIETSINRLSLGTAGYQIVIDPTAVVFGESSMTSNYIYTSPLVTDIDSGSGTLNICSNNIVVSGTNFNYAVHPTVWTGDTQIADKKYVDDNIGGNSLYTYVSPSTVEVGGLPALSTLTGYTSNQLLEKILVKYLLPAFSSFSIFGLSSIVEVGCSIPLNTSCLFNWGFTNGGNVSGGTMCIRDVTAGQNRAVSISTTPPQSANITPTGALTFSACGQSQSWCGSAKNTCGTQFGSSVCTVTAYLPYYWGKCTCPYPSGVNRPTATSAMVTGGTKVLNASSGSISIPYNSGASDYLWFAIPSTVSPKTCWCVPALAVGDVIGGGVGAGCNLFLSPFLDGTQNIMVTTACWACPYDVYISNKQSQFAPPMTIS